MYEHWLLDNPVIKGKGTQDPDYEKEEPPESYYDPEFDEAWASDEPPAEQNTNVVPEIPSKTVKVGEDASEKTPIDETDNQRWEEVD